MFRRLLELLGLRPRRVPAAAPAPQGTIAQVLARMEALETELGPDDGVRWFNRLYLEVTKQVASYDEGGPQAAPGFLERLDVAFAHAYFTALEAAGDSDAPPADFPYRAWRPLFRARYRRDIAPVQFALAGMNAHINHDLALGICAVCIERGVQPRKGSPEHEDYLRVNPLIAEVERGVNNWLMTGLLKELNRDFGSVDNLVAVWSVERARDAAWTRAGVLWHLRDEPALSDEYVRMNDHATGLAGGALLTPVGLAA